MEKTRTLPPLVRGRVSGVLDFFVDEIKLRNRSDNFNLILQVQWWGEDLPTFIRPKKSFYQGNRFNKSTGIYYPQVNYEIKTTLNLFRLYLQTCEVLEFCVVDTVKNCIIGSAFLSDLTKLLNKGNNFNKLPIFDYLGEQIGDTSVCFTFLEKKPEEISYKLENEYNSNLKNNDFNTFDKSDEYYFTPNEDNFFYKSYKKMNGKSHFDSGKIDKYASNKIKRADITYNQDKSKNFPTKSKSYVDDDKILESTEYSCKCLPEIKTASDSSKILHFGLSSQKNRKINDEKNFKTGVIKKFSSDSIKCKSKSKKIEKLDIFPSNHRSCGRKLSKKKIESQNISKHIPKQAEVKRNEICLVDKSKQVLSSRQTDSEESEDILSKEPLQTKVLDYLLGSKLSKEDEESAVNEFKKMSPSHNLVTSINQLCLTSDSDSHNSANMHHSNSLKLSQLSFNLNNPIERNYYEKFFLTSKPSFDLELAELLNQPENSAALEDLKSTDVSHSKKTHATSESRKFSVQDKEVENNKNLSEIGCNIENKAKDCSRCRYYKKLDELDAIIESLKHFEEKMLRHEKDMQLEITGNGNLFRNKYQLKNS